MNPYSPPKAQLADPASDEGQFDKAPSSTTKAVWLIAASLAIGLVRLAVMPVPGPLWFALLIVAILVGFTVAIAKGKNWARVIFGFFFVVGLPGLVMMRERLLQEGSLSVAIMAVQTVLQLVGVVLLFLPESNAWFRFKRRKSRETS